MAPFTNIIIATALILALPAFSAPTYIVIDRRQLAGESNACSSLLSSTDNGIGYGVENAEDNVATLLGGKNSNGGGTGGGAAPPTPHKQRRSVEEEREKKMQRRQADKIANGAANVLNAAKLGSLADLVQTDGDNVDGQLTDDATEIGAQFGGDEEDVLERLGNLVPSQAPTTGM